jgi:serine/threonine-protein kinase
LGDTRGVEDDFGGETLTISRAGELVAPAPRAPAAAVVGELTVEEAVRPGPVTIGRLGGDAIAAFREARERQPKNKTLAMLGKGAMGEVLVARDRDLNRIVAVKRIDPTKDVSAGDIDRFYTEAQITAQLDHPAIVPVYDIDLDTDSRLTYSMKLVRGITLREYIAETRRQVQTSQGPDEDHGLVDRLEVFLAVCAAMAYAHSRGVIHRDLKPDNIMLGAFHEVVVMDWGIARVVAVAPEEGEGEGAPGRRRLTPAADAPEDFIIGTPLYMAPEQARGDNASLGPASDQAALGLILYELASLQKPYSGKDVLEIVLAAASGKKRPMDSGLEKVPRELKAIIHKATALRPEDRYASVQELANDVRRFVQNEEVLAAPDGPVQRLTRWMSRNRSYALAIGMGLLLAALAIGAAVYVSGQAALEAQRVAAHERERALAGWVGAVTARAESVNAAIDHWQAQLTGMAYAAQVALTRPPQPDQSVFDCTDLRTAPGDLAPAAAFFTPVSASRLCVEPSPGVAKATLTRRFEQVMGLSAPFRRARLVSGGPAALDLPRAQQDKLIRDEHLPILFSYMGMPEGIMVTYPGRDTARNDYDPRQRPWYVKAAKTRGLLWMAIDSKSRRKGLVLTGSMAVRDPDTDALIGVAAIDVEFTTIIDSLLVTPEGMPKEVETYLLDRDGAVVVQSSMRAVSDELTEFVAAPFPYPEVAKRFPGETSGSAATGAGAAKTLVVWSSVRATGWTFVAVGRYEDLMAP